MMGRTLSFVYQKLFKRFSTTLAESDIVIRPYDEIPGPKGPLGMGNIYKYMPIIGDYSWDELHKAGFDKYQKYGSIVKETMIPGQDIVWLYDPKDIATLLNEKNYPQRRSHLALQKYRKDRPHIYKTGGLLPTNGEEWWRLRSQLQKEVSAPKSVRSFLPYVDKTTEEFLNYLPKMQNFDALPELARLNLELTCLVTFGVRLDPFNSDIQLPDSKSSKLLNAAETTNSCILPTDQGFQIWRYFMTPTYRKLTKSQEVIESFAISLVKEKLDSLKAGNIASNYMIRSSLIEEYLKNPNLDLSDIVGTAADFLLAGIDTTSYTTGHALYYIATHPEVQKQLYEESAKVLENKSTALSDEMLDSEIPFTRAVLKEVFRLNPISIGVGRILNNDMILGGYSVPKGTVVVTQNMIACRLESNFKDPLKFMPQRWFQQPRNSVNPYLVLPFGHGMRACIARRLAEQGILVLLLKLIRKYEITWHGSSNTMDVKTLLINKPSEAINIRLRERT